jgi:hypothetical protein
MKKNGELSRLKNSATLLLDQLVEDPDRAAEPMQVLYDKGDPQWADKIDVQREAAVEILPPISGPLVRETDEPMRSFAVTAPSSLEAKGTVRGNDLLGLSPDEGRRYGSLVHAWFEQVAYVDQEGGIPADSVLKETARREAPDMTDELLEQRLGEFRDMLKRPAIADALKKGEETRLWRERRFMVRTAAGIIRGSFDRVIIFDDAAGEPRSALIVDYKTDRVSTKTVGEAVERYRPQLHAYRRALSAMLGLPEDAIQGRLLFVCAGLVE